MSTHTFSAEEWDELLGKVSISKTELNALVMNYLVIEGHKDAAEVFQRESGTPADVDLSSIAERMQIRRCVEEGRIEDAIDQVNDLNAQILDTNPRLFFDLLKQHLIELIRSGDAAAALSFAQKELAPLAEDQPEFLDELEEIMTLLAFAGEPSTPAAGLLEPSQRHSTASELNEAILRTQSQETQPRLPTLIRRTLWAEEKLAQHARFPHLKDIPSARLGAPAASSAHPTAMEDE